MTGLGYFCTKVAPYIWKLFGQFFGIHLATFLLKTAVATFWAIFWNTFGYFFIKNCCGYFLGNFLEYIWLLFVLGSGHLPIGKEYIRYIFIVCSFVKIHCKVCKNKPKIIQFVNLNAYLQCLIYFSLSRDYYFFLPNGAGFEPTTFSLDIRALPR